MAEAAGKLPIDWQFFPSSQSSKVEKGSTARYLRATLHILVQGSDMSEPSSTDTQTTQRGKLPQLSTADAQAFLSIIQGEGVGREVELRDTPLMLGRSSECDLRLLNRAVSRLHCRVWRDNTGFWLRDLNSTNKTYLNERPVVEARLKDGDAIAVGGTTLKFMVRGAAPGQAESAAFDYATTDPLTGLANRRYFETELDKEIARCARHGRAFALALIDIDGLEAIAKTHGQEASDDVLRSLGKMVLGGLRHEDTAGRTGGFEFAILLVEVSRDPAVSVLQAVRSAVANAGFGASRSLKVSLSIGMAMWNKESAADRVTLLQQSQAQLDRAKQLGGNRVAFEGSE